MQGQLHLLFEETTTTILMGIFPYDHSSTMVR